VGGKGSIWFNPEHHKQFEEAQARENQRLLISGGVFAACLLLWRHFDDANA
jgi:ribosomal protein L19E